MGVVVFDADVLIGFLGREDTHHAEAVRRVQKSLEHSAKRAVSVVTYSEILVGPLRALGEDGARIVDERLTRLSIETVAADEQLARQAAEVRAQTGLKLPDAYAIATAIDAGRDGDDVSIESFDDRVVKAFARLRR